MRKGKKILLDVKKVVPELSVIVGTPLYVFHTEMTTEARDSR